ncbi:MAG: transglycosylase SLT domain-containing protein [Treponema sp.]|nr:transglycosylase SLT domain-containing protein [Treponema sp.]
MRILLPGGWQRTALPAVLLTVFISLFAAASPSVHSTAVTSTTAKPHRVYTNIGGIPVSKSAYAQNMIQKYIAQYTTRYGAEELYKTLDAGEMYRLYIRAELKKRKMPAAIEYLPLVESNYKPLATSKSGARGLWQFMENSIQGFLHKTEWVDERLDPWLSTDAALTKLQDNYRAFGDWPLAIAAYNCGAGAMRRILKKARAKTFWYIAEHGLLRDQSVQYVPKLLAIAELSEHGESYSVRLPSLSVTTRYADFDYLTLTGQISLRRLESELRIQEGRLAELNPQLLRGCTAPKSPTRLRLPSGMETSARLAVQKILEEQAEPPVRTHTVQKGDTLYSLSRQYGISVSAICRESGIHKNDILSIGKTLYIPVQCAETN